MSGLIETPAIDSLNSSQVEASTWSILFWLIAIQTRKSFRYSFEPWASVAAHAYCFQNLFCKLFCSNALYQTRFELEEWLSVELNCKSYASVGGSGLALEWVQVEGVTERLDEPVTAVMQCEKEALSQ